MNSSIKKIPNKLLPLFLMLFACGCLRFFSQPVVIYPRTSKSKVVYIETTAYCDCQKCCEWEYNWRRQPVFATGPNKGKLKVVGICADGTKAKYGTLAADTRYFPFGTRIHIPGYGMGVVHDRGSAIKGAARLDLFFDTHQKALNWGRKKVEVKVFYK